MTYGRARASQIYAAVGNQSGIEGASPHRLIQLLLESALDRLAKTRGYIMRGEIAAKCSAINKVINIIAHLRASIDLELDTPISANLDALYVYMGKRLFAANRDNDTAVLDEVITLMREIKSGWDEIPQSYRSGYVAAANATSAAAHSVNW